MRSRFVRRTILILAVAAALVVAGRVYYGWRYPYGASHCCISVVMMALEQYAENHDGQYPSGQLSPEASLSLLYREQLIDSYTLRGMSVPAETTRKILEQGKLLDPDSCGWHYVPGLSQEDNPDMGILWNKHALGHNGDRTDGGRQVIYVGARIEYVPGTNWLAFVAEQDRLLQKRRGPPLLSATFLFPNGSTSLVGSYTIDMQAHGLDGSGPSSSKGTATDGRTRFNWYSLPWSDRPITNVVLSLHAGTFTSVPISVSYDGTNCVPERIVFKMQSRLR